MAEAARDHHIEGRLGSPEEKRHHYGASMTSASRRATSSRRALGVISVTRRQSYIARPQNRPGLRQGLAH